MFYYTEIIHTLLIKLGVDVTHFDYKYGKLVEVSYNVVAIFDEN